MVRARGRERPPLAMGCTASREMDESPTPVRVAPPSESSLNDDDHPFPHRLSVSYSAKELGSPRASSAAAVAAAAHERIGALAGTLGSHTRHGVVPGPSGTAYAKINQDRGALFWPFNDSHNEALLCVFDGHGAAGEKVAELCIKKIPQLLQERGGELRSDPPAVLTRTVLDTEDDVLTRNGGRFARACGCTSIIVYLKGNNLWSACSGDSRAVMGSTKRGKIVAKDLSEDCKPDNPVETARIVAAGGTVSAATGARPSRVWANGKIGLAMSRSIGDGECKKYGVIADPDIKQFELSPPPPTSPHSDGDRFIIVASDGVWEFITSQEACEIVASIPTSASKASAALVQEAAQRWKDIEGNYRDDITAIVAYLPFTRADEPSKNDMPPDRIAKATSGSLEAALVDNSIYINMGEKGISPLTSEDASPLKMVARKPATEYQPLQKEESADDHRDGGPAMGRAGDADEDEDDKGSFANRRLSIATPVGEFALSESFDEEDWDGDGGN